MVPIQGDKVSSSGIRLPTYISVEEVLLETSLVE